MKPDVQTHSHSSKQLNDGILGGVGDEINRWLGCLDSFHKDRAFRELGQRSFRDLECLPLFNETYRLIGQNWDGQAARSKQLWRWKPNPNCSEKRTEKSEVRLERAIIGLASEGCLKFEDCDWANQMPTSSGLSPTIPGTRSNKNGPRNIDLIRRRSPTEYDFIELKIADKHPLYAAMEILCYAMLYIFCREKKATLQIENANNRNLLCANTVHLRVLAPVEFYQRCRVEWLSELETVFNRGIAQFAASKESGLKMDFRFDQFPSGFQCTIPELQKALTGIQPVCSG